MNAHSAILDSFMALLDGKISVPVYRMDVNENETGNYVVVRPESGSGANNKRSIADQFVVITDVVTTFENNVNGSVVDGIDAEIFDLILPKSQGHGLKDASGLQIININREGFTYLQEQDNTKHYLRKVSRYSIIIYQTA